MRKFFGKLTVLATLLLLTLMAAACAGNGYRNVTAEEARELIQQGAKIIDIRSEIEFKQGHIPGSMHIPFSELAETAKQWPKDQKILVVCASGSRSVHAAQLLVEKGYTEVYNLAGGIYQWPYGLVK